MPDFYYLILGLVLLVALAALVAERRSSKIDHQAPEHRAKENELYEAFGLDTQPTKEPKDHEDKQEEVEAAFKNVKANKKSKKKKNKKGKKRR